MNDLSSVDKQVEMTLTRAAKADQDYIPDSVVFIQPRDRDVVVRKSSLEEELAAAQEKIKSLEHDSELMRGLLSK